MTLYEIKCAQTWAWYEGYVHEYDDEKKLFEVSYENDWKPRETVPASHIRKLPEYADGFLSSWIAKSNEVVECKAKAEENEPYGWWSCTLKAFHTSHSGSQNLFYVAFDGWGDQHNEMLEQEYIRPKSTQKCLSNRTMQRISIDVESIVCPWVASQPSDFQLASQYPKLVHSCFQKLQRATSRTVKETKRRLRQNNNNNNNNNKRNNKRNKKGNKNNNNNNNNNNANNNQFAMYETLVVERKIEIGGHILIIAPERIAKRIKDFIYLKLEQRKVLLLEEKKTQDTEIELQQHLEKEQSAEKFSFAIHPLLTGYLLGRRRVNIEEVHKRVPGVVNVRVEDGECQIRAQTKEALTEALEYLEIVAKKVLVPYHEMAFIIGREGTQIQKLRTESQAIRVVSWNKFPIEFDRLKTRHIERLQRTGNEDYDDNDNNNRGGRGNNRRNNNNKTPKMVAIPAEIANCTEEDLFAETDVIDFTRDLQSKFESVVFEDDFNNSNKTNNNNNNNNKNNEENNSNPDADAIANKVPKSDALVIIGRKSRVNLCISMIEIMIEHLRRIENIKIESHIARNQIRTLKGLEALPYRFRQNMSPNNDSMSSSQSPRQWNNDRNNSRRRGGGYGNNNRRGGGGGQFQGRRYNGYYNNNNNNNSNTGSPNNRRNNRMNNNNNNNNNNNRYYNNNNNNNNNNNDNNYNRRNNFDNNNRNRNRSQFDNNQRRRGGSGGGGGGFNNNNNDNNRRNSRRNNNSNDYNGNHNDGGYQNNRRNRNRNNNNDGDNNNNNENNNENNHGMNENRDADGNQENQNGNHNDNNNQNMQNGATKKKKKRRSRKAKKGSDMASVPDAVADADPNPQQIILD